MAAHDTLSWEEIVDRGKQHNKTVICEVEKRGEKRYFRLKCDICETVIEKYLQRFNNCSKCAYISRRSNDEEFINKAVKIQGNNYDYSLIEYINSRTKVKIKHNTCNTFFYQTPHNHLKGQGCPKCKNDFKRSNNKDFIYKSNIIHPGKFDYSLVQYINSRTKVKIKCNSCYTLFYQNPQNHLNGSGCPKCNESKGELKVAKYLSGKNIRFIPQKTFQTLRDIRPLKCDFYLEDLNLLIEYDGEFHFKPIKGSTPELKQKRLELQQRRDKIKNEWVKANNIPLLRIPYWDYDRIEELIDAFILQHTRKKEVKQLVLEM